MDDKIIVIGRAAHKPKNELLVSDVTERILQLEAAVKLRDATIDKITKDAGDKIISLEAKVRTHKNELVEMHELRRELTAVIADLRRIIGREVSDSASEYAHIMSESDKGSAHDQWVSELVRLAGETRKLNTMSTAVKKFDTVFYDLCAHAFNSGIDP